MHFWHYCQHVFYSREVFSCSPDSKAEGLGIVQLGMVDLEKGTFIAFDLSAMIIAVLFKMTYTYSMTCFERRSILELIVFICGLVVLKRNNTIKDSIIMTAIGVIPAFVLKVLVPWTSDAIYRETPDMIELRRNEGCITVEKEAAAFFAVPKY